MFDDLVRDPETAVQGKGIWGLSHHIREQVIDRYHHSCSVERWRWGVEFDSDQLRIECITFLELFEYDDSGHTIGFLV